MNKILIALVLAVGFSGNAYASDLPKLEGNYISDHEANREREERRKKEEIEREIEEKKIKRIYNACLLDKGKGQDLQVSSIKNAVEETCLSIAYNPSWYENFKYD